MIETETKKQGPLHPVNVYICSEYGGLCCGCDIGPAETCGLSSVVIMMANENGIVDLRNQ